jgi:hypothetical protein
MRFVKVFGLITIGASIVALACPVAAGAGTPTTSFSGSCSFHAKTTATSADSFVVNGAGTCTGSWDGAASATTPVAIHSAASGLEVDGIPVFVNGTVTATTAGGDTLSLELLQVGLGFVFRGTRSGFGLGAVILGSPDDTIDVVTATPVVS